MINRIHQSTDTQGTLARRVIGMAMKVHSHLGCGFVETIYRNALVIELRKTDLAFELHPTLSVIYESVEIGIFQADLIIEKALVVELKAVEGLSVAHSVQLVNYLAAAKIEEGLLLNFGAKSLEFKSKALHWNSAPSHSPPNLQQ